MFASVTAGSYEPGVQVGSGRWPDWKWQVPTVIVYVTCFGSCTAIKPPDRACTDAPAELDAAGDELEPDNAPSPDLQPVSTNNDNATTLTRTARLLMPVN